MENKNNSFDQIREEFDREDRIRRSSSFYKAIKQMYGYMMLNDLVYDKNPFLSMIPKDSTNKSKD